jgi:hypothetical protein
MRPDELHDEPSDEELVLYHYGEAPDPLALEARIAASPAAQRRLDELRQVLATVDETWTAPSPGPTYEAELWERLRLRLAAARRPEGVLDGRGRFGVGERVRRWLPSAAAAGLLLAVGYLAGRLATDATPPPAAPPALSAEARQRLLIGTLADHLERSERLFTELDNLAADETGGLAGEREAAGRLLDDNRLYRAAAEQGGRAGVAALLSELEPVLLELAHMPAEPAAEDVELLRQRIEAHGLLFKTRVASELLNRTLLPPPSTTPKA